MLSVVVPVYRNVVLAEYCLTRLLACVPAGTEVIVVDDASGLETHATLRKFTGIRLIEHEHNRGNTTAYNTGAQAASGEYLVFIDSDVLLLQDTLSILANALEARPKMNWRVYRTLHVDRL